jgi:hypothetical protein
MSISKEAIRPYDRNPFYWQYGGKPTMLLGGSREDNLFQVPDIVGHLDLLAACGGNYVRCTMSSRDPGDAWPFEREEESGLYDLERPSGEYWRRFRGFLEATVERGIIVQIELWDRFDFAREPWRENPFNPKNNSNYTAEDTGLEPEITTHPGRRENSFFRSLPGLKDENPVVLRYQQKHIDALLRISLEYGNVLYCMDNETNEPAAWGEYWCRYIKDAAMNAGRRVYATEMWDAHSLDSDHHERTWGHPETYDFIDISQNSHNSWEEHWENLSSFRRRIVDTGVPRPMNTVKIYGAKTGSYGTGRDARERFWRDIIGGCASARFHRPPAGLGLTDIVQRNIRSARMFLDELEIFSCEPRNDLLTFRSHNEAFCTAETGTQYGVYFPADGEVFLDIAGMKGNGALTVFWLDIDGCRWVAPERIPDGVDTVRLSTPGSGSVCVGVRHGRNDDGPWACVLKYSI